ncbi:alpha/beta fold hydrolase [Mesohalobacter halotolerans]|uniref:Alpha/beta fold hydrolase n=1 Tax=Mesohalobacter halotolerans TaxID=1883405 RepID=A0A4U5TNE3_9FLAO|nr:alpha/beta fold hydrolase [Mesohalobacter halotolerans]MBS3737627.1 alpha/beta fold hydrolase [Psychroflexus sp.]TKS55457.1 alpha/beta fold hydrolase [Mesohalobacter halotolerans]
MKLHSQITGKGHPLIILHGFLGMGDNWKTLSKAYAKSGYEVHLIDLRNHGKSPHSDDFNYAVMADDIYKYFNDKSLKNAILIGHSMGGKVAMFFACQYPELLSHLIVVDIAPRYYAPHHDDILESLKTLQQTHLTSRKEAENILKEKIDNNGVRMFLLKNLKRENNNTLSLKPNIDVFTNNKENIGQALPEDFTYEGKTLFIKGEHSNYISNVDNKLINSHFSNNKIETISKAGHWVHAENPQAFLRKTLDFIS